MGDEKNTEQIAGRDAWYLDKSLTVSIPGSMGADDLATALDSNRENLEELKIGYAKSRRDQDETERLNYFREILRTVNAIEEIKTRLALFGKKTPVSSLDIEHPDKAVERFRAAQSSGKVCYVTTVVCSALGRSNNCRELYVLRKFRDEQMLSSPMGSYLVAEYYRRAPAIIANMEKKPSYGDILRYTYDQFILPAVNAAERGETEQTFDLYLSGMVFLYLSDMAFIESKVQKVAQQSHAA